MVAEIATAMAATTTARKATRRRGSNAIEMVMDSDVWCNDNAPAMTGVEGMTATQR